MYELCMKKRTTIQIENETLEKMKKLKITKEETYDEILNRLMKEGKWTKTNKMQMYLGEFIDRCSIHLHKAQKIGPRAYPEFVRYIEEFLLEIPIKNFDEIMKGFRELYRINGEIWKLESIIRQGKENKIGIVEVGKRSLEIRGWNTKRIAEQNRLIDLFGGFKNIKKDHVSTEK